jgi:DNA replicative helicase MCM subunit Mcm2 (Cdc46/Mcm family)
MFDGEVDTQAPDWHTSVVPGSLVSPDQTVSKDDYKEAFTKCLVESFEEEVQNLLRRDTTSEQQVNRWGDYSSSSSSSSSSFSSSSSAFSTPFSHANNGTYPNNNSDDDDEITASQEAQRHKKEKHYGLEISHRLLCDACPLLAHAVIHALQSHTTDTEEKDHGELIWESFNEAALEAQKKVYGNECNMVKECNGGNTQSSGYRQEMADLSRDMSIKHNVNVRLVDLCGGLRKPNVSSIRSFDVGTFVEIGGTCTRTGMIKMVESVRYYQCESERCDALFPVRADVDRAYGIDEPKGCPQTACKSKRCVPIPERAVCRDW